MVLVIGIQIATPRDAQTLQQALTEALEWSTGPTVLRFPKGEAPVRVEPVHRYDDGAELLYTPGPEQPAYSQLADVMICDFGPFAQQAIAAAQRASHDGISVSVIDPRWAHPMPSWNPPLYNWRRVQRIRTCRCSLTARTASGCVSAAVKFLSDRFVAQTPSQIYSARLSEGTSLCSGSPMYRLLHDIAQDIEDSAVSGHRPGDAFTWDITKLAGPLTKVCTTMLA